MKMPSPRSRRYLYRAGIAGLAVLGVYGLVNSEEIAAWSILAAALLGMADANVEKTE
ncbi:hypothetical protein [Promicromonospora sp. NPDC050262]|uniref:hypothetical protein n=1 Tax=Promicromonospora sp. NPDC050262 TaxID=3155036 RepID=UPI0033CEE659